MTDPNVFGESFKYCRCRQLTNKGTTPTLLSQLTPGSLILFGSKINKNFVLDTVFVVSEKMVDYSLANIQQVRKDYNLSAHFYYASIEPMLANQKDGDDENNCRLTDQMLKLYYGAGFNDKENFNGMYSFSPCRIFSNNTASTIFKRPTLTPSPFIVPDLTDGFNSQGQKEFTIEEVAAFWNEIKDQLNGQQLYEGVFFKNPPLSR
jgi:hypothetical protein